MPLPGSPLPSPVPVACLSLGHPQQPSGLQKEFHFNNIELSCRNVPVPAGSELQGVGWCPGPQALFMPSPPPPRALLRAIGSTSLVCIGDVCRGLNRCWLPSWTDRLLCSELWEALSISGLQAFCPPGDLGRCLEIFFMVTIGRRREVLLVSRGKRLGLLLNTPQPKGQPHHKELSSRRCQWCRGWEPLS